MTNKVHIDAPAGIVEIEGERDFVEGLLTKLLPLLEEARFGARPLKAAPIIGSDPSDVPEAAEIAPDQNSKTKPKRRKVSVPPKGQSCAARIMTLKEEGFFAEQRTIAKIIDGLKSKGWTHNASQIGAALSNMFVRGDIQRTKEGNSSWKYYWDRG